MADDTIKPGDAAEGDDVEGHLFQSIFQQIVPKTPKPKTKDYDFGADTIEGDLVKPEGT